MRTSPDGWLEQGTPESTFKDNNEYFCHIISRDYEIPKTAHRLYFNIGDKEIEFANEFLDRCRYLHKIPHYLKFHKFYKRDDGFVIYVDDEHLDQTIAIIEQIGREYPEFRVNNGMPMSTYDCGWYGYGKELKNNHSSFNGNVANCIAEVIGQIMAEMGYDVFEKVRVGQNEFVDEVVDEKAIEAANTYAPYLQDENISNQFYGAFRERLANMLYSRGLLLTDQTVPNCISELDKANYFGN